MGTITLAVGGHETTTEYSDIKASGIQVELGVKVARIAGMPLAVEGAVSTSNYKTYAPAGERSVDHRVSLGLELEL